VGAEGGAGTPTRAGAPRRFAVAAVLAALFVLHQDVWLWHDARVVFGLPIGLGYHVAFCLVVTAALLLAVRVAWPLEVPLGGDGAVDAASDGDVALGLGAGEGHTTASRRGARGDLGEGSTR
jgi:hypothetical protein